MGTMFDVFVFFQVATSTMLHYFLRLDTTMSEDAKELLKVCVGFKSKY